MCLHLECPTQFCSSSLRKDIFERGKVQGKVTRMIKGVEQLPNQESLNRIGWKWNDGVGIWQRSINHRCVPQGRASWAQWEHCPLQAATGGIMWWEKVVDGKQGKGGGCSHNVFLSSGVLCLRMSWIPVVSKNNQANAQSKGSEGTATFYRCSFHLFEPWVAGWQECIPGKY